MIHTVDNPKMVESCIFRGVTTFTGVTKDKHGLICYYKKGKIHREDGPAVIWANGRKDWWIHDKRHRVDGPAIEYASGEKAWFYNNITYGWNDKFTVESWILHVANLEANK